MTETADAKLPDAVGGGEKSEVMNSEAKSLESTNATDGEPSAISPATSPCSGASIEGDVQTGTGDVIKSANEIAKNDEQPKDSSELSPLEGTNTTVDASDLSLQVDGKAAGTVKGEDESSSIGASPDVQAISSPEAPPNSLHADSGGVGVNISEQSKGQESLKDKALSGSTTAGTEGVGHIAAQQSSKPKEYAKVLRAHDASSSDQLPLQVGTVIVIVSKDTEDSRDNGESIKWLGECNGKRGVFPASCVSVISAEEAEKLKGRPLAPPALPAKPAKFKPSVTNTSVASSPSPERAVDDAPGNAALQVTPSPPQKPARDKPDAASPSPGSAESRTDKSDKSPRIGKKQFLQTKHFISGIFRNREKSPKPDEKLSTSGTDIKTAGSDVESVGESLSHLTTQRPRNQNRRPPSRAFLTEMAAAEDNQTAAPKASASPVLSKQASAMLPCKPLRPPPPTVKKNTNMDQITEHLKDEFVSKEEFNKLLAAFDDFRRDVMDRIKELETGARVPSDGCESAQ